MKSFIILISFIFFVFNLCACNNSNAEVENLKKEIETLKKENEEIQNNLNENTSILEISVGLTPSPIPKSIVPDSTLDPIQIINIGELIILDDYYEFTLGDVIFQEELKSRSNDDSIYYKAQTNETYVCVYSLLKNFKDDNFYGFSSIEFICNNRYKYDGSFMYENLDKTRLSNDFIKPLAEKYIILYTSIPNEIIENDYPIEVSFNFFDVVEDVTEDSGYRFINECYKFIIQ